LDIHCCHDETASHEVKRVIIGIFIFAIRIIIKEYRKFFSWKINSISIDLSQLKVHPI